jgi:hypothetical protein
MLARVERYAASGLPVAHGPHCPLLGDRGLYAVRRQGTNSIETMASHSTTKSGRVARGRLMEEDRLLGSDDRQSPRVDRKWPLPTDGGPHGTQHLTQPIWSGPGPGRVRPMQPFRSTPPRTPNAGTHATRQPQYRRIILISTPTVISGEAPSTPSIGYDPEASIPVADDAGTVRRFRHGV